MHKYVLFIAFVAAGACGSGGIDSDQDMGDHDYDDGTSDCIEGPCPDGGGSFDDDDPIDPACAGTAPVNSNDLLVPKWPPLAPTVPADCLRGFEVNRLTQYVHSISSIQGSRAITLEVDIATYTAPDAIRISAVDGSGVATILVDTCRMRTAQYADPTMGTVRPPEDSIRDYRVALPAGSKQLVVDNSHAETPTYIRILGLCDFNIQPPPTTALNSTFFRIVTSR